MDGRRHLVAEAEVYGNVSDRQKSRRGVHAGRFFLAARGISRAAPMRGFLPCKSADFPLDRPRDIRYNETGGKNCITFVRWFRERLRRHGAAAAPKGNAQTTLRQKDRDRTRLWKAAYGTEEAILRAIPSGGRIFQV